MPPFDRAKLRRLAEAATPGPWHHYRDKLRPQFSGRVNEVQAAGERAVVRWSGFDDSARPEKQHAANAAYIAAASPDVILSALSEIDRLTLEVESAERRIADVKGDATLTVLNHARTLGARADASELREAALQSQVGALVEAVGRLEIDTDGAVDSDGTCHFCGAMLDPTRAPYSPVTEEPHWKNCKVPPLLDLLANLPAAVKQYDAQVAAKERERLREAAEAMESVGGVTRMLFRSAVLALLSEPKETA